jgi:hypothetical protein
VIFSASVAVSVQHIGNPGLRKEVRATVDSAVPIGREFGPWRDDHSDNIHVRSTTIPIILAPVPMHISCLVRPFHHLNSVRFQSLADFR